MDRECLAREFVCSMTYHVLVTCEYSACALLAKGASQAQILSMLRWRSDEAHPRVKISLSWFVSVARGVEIC